MPMCTSRQPPKRFESQTRNRPPNRVNSSGQKDVRGHTCLGRSRWKTPTLAASRSFASSRWLVLSSALGWADGCGPATREPLRVQPPTFDAGSRTSGCVMGLRTQDRDRIFASSVRWPLPVVRRAWRSATRGALWPGSCLQCLVGRSRAARSNRNIFGAK